MKNVSYERWLFKSILNALKVRRVISLEGARQCGKTTLAKSIDALKIYRTLDDVTLLQAAKNDPHTFVSHGNELMIIDEIQRVPELLLAIKKDVDLIQTPGRFLITGSANIQTLPNVKESLAGRLKKLRLRTLSIGEINGKSPNFIDNLFSGKFKSYGTSTYNKDTYLDLAFKGGYPEAIRLNKYKEVQSWHHDYINAIIENDLRDIINIYRKDSLNKLIAILAAWSSKFMDISKITSHLSIARNTVESYINVLESLYLIERVKPWIKTDYDRVGKQDKIFYSDSGLMASILNWNFDEVRLDGEQGGKLLETFVYTQLAVIIDASDDTYNLSHYRDRDKREIDFILEDDKGNILAIEVKAGSAVTKSSFKHIEWFKENMAQRTCTGIVLYTGEHVVSFAKDLWAVPISCLFAG